MNQKAAAAIHTLVPLAWMVFVWCALWQDFGLANFAFGLILSAAALFIFRLPALYLSNRFNIFYAISFVLYLFWKNMVVSLQIFWFSLTYKKPLRNSIVAVQLRTTSDLLITAISHSMSIIPGSVVVEVDRPNSVLFFHVLDAKNEKDIEKFHAQVHKVETMILRAVGSKEEYEMIKKEAHQ